MKVRSLSPAEAESALDDGSVEAVISDGQLRSKEEADDQLVGIAQAAARQVRQAEALRQAGLSGAELQQALNPPALKVTTVEPVDPERDRKGGFAFFAVIVLYASCYDGYLLAGGVVEEKASRVVEVLLSTIRPKELLGGKIIGLGPARVRPAAADRGGPAGRHRRGRSTSTATWSPPPRWRSAGSWSATRSTRPVRLRGRARAPSGGAAVDDDAADDVILISFFVSFTVLDDPDGTLAHVTAYIPFTAPITMPPRIALGEAPAYEIVIALAVTARAALALIPLAGRIYSGAVLRTGSAVKVRDAWRASARARA